MKTTRKTRSPICEFCHKPFVPDPRTAQWQRACSDPCKALRKRQSQKSWTARNPDYWRDRRLREKAAQVELDEVEPGAVLGALPFLDGLPSDFAQEALSSKALVLLAYLLRELHRVLRRMLGSQHARLTKEIRKLQSLVAQDEIERQARSP